MARFVFFVFLMLLFNSCMVTENLEIAENGSGNLAVVITRDEKTYMKFAPEQYQAEEIFKDSTYFFKDIIAKHPETYARFSAKEKALYVRFAEIVVREERNSATKRFVKTISTSFQAVESVPNLSVFREYISNIVHNYALDPNDALVDFEFLYDGKIFKRTALTVTATAEETRKKDVGEYRKALEDRKSALTYTLRYKFPKRIQKVSNLAAIIGDDGKSMTVVYSILDAGERPEITNLEVTFE